MVAVSQEAHTAGALKRDFLWAGGGVEVTLNKLTVGEMAAHFASSFSVSFTCVCVLLVCAHTCRGGKRNYIPASRSHVLTTLSFLSELQTWIPVMLFPIHRCMVKAH